MQRDVFDWYETNQYKDDAGELFSRDWQSRLARWGQEFEQDTTDLDKTIASCQSRPETLELGQFFQAHSIAAFSLWHVLQACYGLDKVICGRSTPAYWENLRPFEYLLSPQIILSWRGHLNSFSSEIEGCNDKIQKEAVAIHLDTLAEKVRFLEEALATLETIFAEKKQEMPCSYWMLSRIQEGVDNRCLEIERILDLENFGNHKAALGRILAADKETSL